MSYGDDELYTRMSWRSLRLWKELFDALDVSKEDEKTRQRYGYYDPSKPKGDGAPRVPQNLLLARRLVEAGAVFSRSVSPTEPRLSDRIYPIPTFSDTDRQRDEDWEPFVTPSAAPGAVSDDCLAPVSKKNIEECVSVTRTRSS